MSNYTCQHSECNGNLRRLADDPLLPEYIDLLECVDCDEVYELDLVDGSLEVDA